MPKQPYLPRLEALETLLEDKTRAKPESQTREENLTPKQFYPGGVLGPESSPENFGGRVVPGTSNFHVHVQVLTQDFDGTGSRRSQVAGVNAANIYI